MALTTAQANNKLIKFRRKTINEYIRENLFSPYMGSSESDIIYVYNDLKDGGEQINFPLIARLTAAGKGVGTLVGNEEEIDNYGFRCWIDWKRHAVAIKKSEQHKSSVDLWAQQQPRLSDWGKEMQRDNICDAFFALPSEAQPVGLGTDDGQVVNGILFDAATAAQRNTWITDNADRILVGDSNSSNLVAGNFASSMANIATTEVLTYANVVRMKRSAKRANPRIKPFKVKENGSEWFVLFVDQENFRAASVDTTIVSINTQARAREGNGYLKNPIFVDGDLLVNGIIIREIPELSTRLPTFYTTAGGSAGRVSPAFLCGAAAVGFGWGQMPKPTFRQENDYQFVRGVGIEMAYGVGKIAKKNPAGNLKEWGIFTGFFAAAADS
jgi:hypothetical protein